MRTSVKGLPGTLIGDLFLAPRHSLLFLETIFSFNFWKAASFLGSNFGFEFGAKTCLFWSLWQIISAWLVLEAAGCEQSGLSLLYCGSTSMIPAAKLWNKSQGRPQLRLQKSYQFQVLKTDPKEASFPCLSSWWQPFPFLICWWKNPKPASEALRGSARPGRGHASDAKPIGTRTKRGSRGLETIILLLKSQQSWTWSSWQLCCLARILGRSWRKETASTQASRPQG